MRLILGLLLRNNPAVIFKVTVRIDIDLILLKLVRSALVYFASRVALFIAWNSLNDVGTA